MSGRAIFLDRDGTLIRDTGYLHKVKDIVWLPGVLGALRQWQHDGWNLVIVTNQSGLGRGLFKEEDYQIVTDRLCHDAKALGINFLAIEHCPHGPDDGCECRKPKPGLYHRVIATHRLDPKTSVAIGDRERDLEAARAVGIRQTHLVEKDAGFSDSLIG